MDGRKGYAGSALASYTDNEGPGYLLARVRPFSVRRNNTFYPLFSLL